jgi:hypothetical protein
MSDTSAEPAAPLGVVVTDYISLHAALRERANQLNISRTTLDGLAGIPDGYASKLLALKPVKIIGPKSLGPVLGALGVRLLLIEDEEAVRRLKHRWKPRKANAVRHTFDPVTDFLRRIAILGGQARARLCSPDERVKIARRAAKARWRKAHARRASITADAA